MTSRKMLLSSGWYPRGENQIRDFVDQSRDRYPLKRKDAFAAIVPHAGWYFSGALANAGIESLKNPEIIVVMGGHLHQSGLMVHSRADYFETPLGKLPGDKNINDLLAKKFNTTEESYADNTVEVHLPLIHFHYPDSKIVYLRVPPNSEIVSELADFFQELLADNQNIGFLASTDLCHYGPNYNYIPYGTGSDSVRKVTEEIDKPFMKALLDRDDQSILDLANHRKAACSAGPCAVISRMAASMEINGQLIGYHTSYDIHRDSSFVGYCSVIF